MAETTLETLSGEQRKHFVRELRRLRRICTILGSKLENELKGSDFKVGRIHSLVLDQSILLDKQHELLSRIRDLEHYGDEELEAAFQIVIREDDGTTRIAGRYVPREVVDAEASGGPVGSDS